MHGLYIKFELKLNERKQVQISEITCRKKSNKYYVLEGVVHYKAVIFKTLPMSNFGKIILVRGKFKTYLLASTYLIGTNSSLFFFELLVAFVAKVTI